MNIQTEIPEDIEASYDGSELHLSEGSETVTKKMDHALVDVETSEDKVTFSTESDKKDVKSILKTFRSHTENMVEGLEDEHVYRLKGVYAHFPMDIKTEDGSLKVENFMGERNPREAEIMEDVEVEVDGEDVTVRGSDKEKVAQTAARIESLSEKGNRDPRTFQDGIYITEAEE